MHCFAYYYVILYYSFDYTKTKTLLTDTRIIWLSSRTKKTYFVEITEQCKRGMIDMMIFFSIAGFQKRRKY